MNTYAAFGVGLGNLGRQSRARVAKGHWISDLNRRLAGLHADGAVVAAYGHTGNFVVSTTGSLTGVAAALTKALDTGCAVLPLTALQELVVQLSTTEPPTSQAGLRWTPGAALLVTGVPRAGDPQGTVRANYVRLRESIVQVYKSDHVTGAGILDRGRRMGGWGAVASEVGRQLGGTWTARSVRTLTGTLKLGIAHATD